VPERSSRRHQRYDNILTLGDGWDEGERVDGLEMENFSAIIAAQESKALESEKLQGQMLMDLIQ